MAGRSPSPAVPAGPASSSRCRSWNSRPGRPTRTRTGWLNRPDRSEGRQRSGPVRAQHDHPWWCHDTTRRSSRAPARRPERRQEPGYTELLVLAERAGLRIHEVPVDWTDDTDSRVQLLATAAADVRGIVRLGGGTRLARFAAVGAASTLAYVLLYLALRGTLGAQAANALSLLVTAVANTAVNRQFTFGITGRRGRPGRRGRLVGRGGPADSGRRPALRGRFHERQHPAARARLQRPRQADRPGDRPRDRLRRLRHRDVARVQRGDRSGPPVRYRHGRPDQLAAPGRTAGPGRAGLGVLAGTTHRPDPGRRAAVGRLAARYRAGVQLHGRHHPPVLHGRAGSADRRAGRDRRHQAVAGPGRWLGRSALAAA